MKRSLLYSIRAKITLAVLLLVVITAVSLTIFMQIKIEKKLLTQQLTISENLLNAMMVSVDNNYQSILYHKKVITKERKDQLQNIITTAYSNVEKMYDLSQRGIISEAQAQKLAIEQLNALRYQKGVGYIWINDTIRNFPTMIMHPTLPELNGTELNSPEFNCALGKNENLFRAFVDITAETGEGFVDYLWPKPLPTGLSKRQPKLSYVKRFEPWGWILGTGLYIDDIEEEITRKVEAVKEHLQNSLKQLAYSESSYGFIFNSDFELIAHPIYRKFEVKELTNPATGNLILADIKKAADTGNGKLTYIWDKPSYKGQFRFKKSAYVVHYKELDWYIATSFYIDEIEEPIIQMRWQTLTFSLIFIIISLLLSLYIGYNLTWPFKKIMTLSERGIKGDYSIRLAMDRRDEFGQLAHNLNEFMADLDISHSELSKSEKRFRTLFEKSSDARLILRNKKIIDCNAAAVTLLGCVDKSNLLDLSPLEISPEIQLDGRRSIDKYADILNKLEHQSWILFEWEHIRQDGTHFLAEIQLTLMDDDENNLIHARLRDITEEMSTKAKKQKAEEQLIQMQKMETVGTLAGGFAHDFNNILSGLVGTVSLLRYTFDEYGTIPPEELQESLKIMEQSGNRAEIMVKQLLTLSRKQTLNFEEIDLNSAVRNVVKLAKGSLDKSVLIDTHFCDSEALIKADSAQIEQVILNFCVNGAHAMTLMRPSDEKWGGTLSISITAVEANTDFCKVHTEAHKGEYWCLSVSDTGIGMDKSTIAKIFTPFFTTKGKGVGTGLGLAMVYNIIHEHDGFVYVYSEVGKGSSFDVYIPKLTTDETSKKTQENSRNIEQGGGTILVIDDEAIMRLMAEKMLSRCGYTVLLAEDGRAGIEMYKKHKTEIDIVLLDMAMPGLSGKDTFIELKKMNEEVKVILSSGFQQDERVQAVLSLGVNCFIQKPYTLQKLAQSIKNLL